MFLVTTDFIKENKDAIIIDCRFEMSNPESAHKMYLESHLKGAYFIDVDKDLTSEIKEHGGRHPLKDLMVFTDQLKTFGIEKNSKVVIYDNGELAMASRLWYMCQLIGLDTYILEGGYDKASQVLETSSQVPSLKTSNLEMVFNKELIVYKDDVIEAMDNPKTVIVDSRANPRYLGLEEPLDKIAGRIPTAVNYFWKDNFVNGHVKDYGDIEAMFLEMNNYDEIILHCGSGITGCVNMFFLNEINIKSKLYAGSYSDWISYEDNEVIIKNNLKKKVKAI